VAKKDSVFFVPENIKQLAEKFREERIASEKLEAQQKQEQKAKERAIRTKRLRTGLDYARKIFLWTNAFRNSFVGQELMKISHETRVYKNIFFFDGHIKGVNWVGLIVNPKELLLSYGGRWSVLGRESINSAKELAGSVDTKILKEACEWIDNGKVWECIERRFDYLKKRDAD